MTLTTPAAIVADSIGLPPMWHGCCVEHDWFHAHLESVLKEGDTIEISDPQTYSGLLRQLAIWCGDDGEAQAYVLTEHSNTGWNLEAIQDARYRENGAPIMHFGWVRRLVDGIRHPRWRAVCVEGLKGITEAPEALIAIITAIAAGEVTK